MKRLGLLLPLLLCFLAPAVASADTCDDPLVQCSEVYQVCITMQEVSECSICDDIAFECVACLAGAPCDPIEFVCDLIDKACMEVGVNCAAARASCEAIFTP